MQRNDLGNIIDPEEAWEGIRDERFFKKIPYKIGERYKIKMIANGYLIKTGFNEVCCSNLWEVFVWIYTMEGGKISKFAEFLKEKINK